MAELVRRSAGSAPDRESDLRVVAFRMYPDSAAMIRLHPGRGKSIVNIQLTAAEADDLAEALIRKRRIP